MIENDSAFLVEKKLLRNYVDYQDFQEPQTI